MLLEEWIASRLLFPSEGARPGQQGRHHVLDEEGGAGLERGVDLVEERLAVRDVQDDLAAVVEDSEVGRLVKLWERYSARRV